jgi:hypothetical protein
LSPRALAPWLLLAPLALAAGCDDASRAPFSIEVVTAAGTNPVAGATTGRLHVLVAQDGQPTRDQAVDLSGGTFQLDVTIASYGTPTRLGVELVRDGVTSLGAVPTFAPLGFAFVRVPVVPVGTCATVATQRLATPRARAAVASIDALVAVVGGLAGDGTAAPGIERFWSPQLTASEGSGSVHPSAFPAGPARALRFAGQPRLLVLSSGASVVDFGGDATEPVSTLTGLHAGAGEASALVDLVASGVAIVGGDDAAAISWVGVDRSVQTSALPTARADAAATRWGASEGILIAGGNAEGEPVLVYVPAGAAAREDVVTFELPGTPGRASRGGALLRSPDGAAALYLGALDAAGVVSTETWVVRGCPRACEVEPGPSWPEAREGFAVVETSTGAWIVGGREGATPSARVERIVWSAGTPVLEPSSLVTARDEAAVTALAGGMVLVVGGRGAERALESFELCAPGTLEPI